MTFRSGTSVIQGVFAKFEKQVEKLKLGMELIEQEKVKKTAKLEEARAELEDLEFSTNKDLRALDKQALAADTLIKNLSNLLGQR